MCSLSTVSLVHSTFFSGFRFRSLMVRLRFSWKVERDGHTYLVPCGRPFPLPPGGLLSSRPQFNQSHRHGSTGAECWGRTEHNGSLTSSRPWGIECS